MRKILLRVVPGDKDRCVVDAAGEGTIVITGDATDAPTLCCGLCVAPLAVAVDRSRLTSMLIECKRCGSFNDTRDSRVE